MAQLSHISDTSRFLGCRFDLLAAPREERAREEFAVFILVELGAFDIEKPQARQPGERERVNHELRDRLVGAGVRLVIEDVHGAVADLQEVDVASDALSTAALWQQPDAVVALKRGDVVGCKPDRHLDGERRAVVG